MQSEILCRAHPFMIEQLHQTYVAVTGFDLRIQPYYERCWFDFKKAFDENDDPVEGLRLLLRDMIRSKAPEYCLKISFICGDESRIGDSLNRIAAIKARMRRGCYSPGKAAVLRATGRADTPEPMVARQAVDVLRKVLDSV